MKPVLIVDDNPTNLKLAAKLLTYDGYSVSLAEDAEIATCAATTLCQQFATLAK